jgi:hypothetical protein
MKDPRVFGVGFHKTGTTTLAHALYSVGYRLTGYKRVNHLLQGSPTREEALSRLWPYFLRRLEGHDAVQDTPWFLFYRRLDEQFPGSRFILTTRDPDRWVRSVTRHFGDRSAGEHRWIYGVDTDRGHESRLIEVYQQHNREVQDYFSGRPSDLLVIDLTAGEDWGRLAPFLGVEEPPFPMTALNMAAERQGARSVLAKSRDLVAPLFGGRSRFREALALYDACYFALESVAGAPADTLPDSVLQPLVDSTRDPVDDLRLALGLPEVTPAPAKMSPANAWRRQDMVIRNTIGAITYASVRERTPRSRRRVGQVAEGVIETVARAGAALKS